MRNNVLDLVNFDLIGKLMQGYFKSTGFATAILDLDGNVLAKSDWYEICTDFHRKHPETCRRCLESDTVLASKVNKGKGHHYYRCLNGLVDVVIPLIIDEDHVANLYFGQLFFEKPDRDFFINQADKYGFDKKRYLQALDKIPVVTEKQSGHVLEFLHTLTAQINEMTLQKIELEKQRDFFRLVIDSAPTRIFWKDLDSVYLGCNLQFAKDAGFDTPEEIIGKNDDELIWQKYAEKFREDDQYVIKTGNNKVCYEDDFFSRDGERISWLTNKKPLCNDRGEVIGVVATAENISRIKNSEKKLSEREERLKLTIEGTNVGTWDMDLETGQFSYNSRYAEMLGYDVNDFTPTQEWYKTIVHPDDLPLTDKRFTDYIAGKADRYEAEYRVKHKEGHWVWISDTGKIIDTDRNNKALKIAGIHIDITARKNIESQLRQSHKMEAVGRLAGGVAHDFNNMLTVIIGHADMMLRKLDESSPLYNNLLTIRKAGKRSADLTKQLLAFARRQTIIPEVICLNEAIANMLKMIERLIGEDINLCWRPQNALWPVVIDPAQVDQVLANLCLNAREAIDGSGTLNIETGNISYGGDCRIMQRTMPPGDYVVVAVSDNGCGMAEETLENIFEPFYTTKDVCQGSGLGLATVYGIVKQNNGFINAYSEVGKGTTFKIYLPRHISGGTSGKSEKEKASEISLQGSETVLIVEDQTDILEVACDFLSEKGYKVISADTPCKALIKAKEHQGPIHLLLTDVIMPVMNGSDLAQNIAMVYPDIKCIFMSGYTADVIAQHGVLDKGVNFIEKPFTNEDLSLKVRSVLDER